MKNGRKLTDLAAELERQNASKKDYVVDTSRMRVEPNIDGGIHLELPVNGVREEMGITEIAHRQIGQTLGIPASYYKKMLAEYPDLLAANVNGWFGREPRERMVRTLDGNARAFLSNRYNRIDNFDVAMAVLPILKDLTDVRIESCELTDSRMYIKAVNPRLQADVSVGDTVQSGVLISNSEVGLGTVTVTPLIFRLVCTNGMVVSDGGVKKRHVGRIVELDDNYSLFSDATKKADDTAFIMKVRDIVKVVSDETRFNMVVDRMKQAHDAAITSENIPGVVELTAKHFGITEDETKGVTHHLLTDGDGYSLYALANAITAQSQQVVSYDRATEMESTGYSVMTMAPSLWKQINTAA